VPHLVVVARHADAAHVLPHEVQQTLAGHRVGSSLPRRSLPLSPGTMHDHRPRLETLGGGGVSRAPLGRWSDALFRRADASHAELRHGPGLPGMLCKQRTRR